MNQWSHTWYRPGDWSLPDWWTRAPTMPYGLMTHTHQSEFYSGRFVRESIGHTGGMTVPPPTRRTTC